MRRALTLIALALVATAPLQAKPNWHKVSRIAFAAAVIGSTVVATEGGRACRHRNGVEPCTAHYGEFTATEASRAGFTGTMLFISLKMDSAHFKDWFVIGGGTAAYNYGWGIHEFRINTHTQQRSTQR